jgi:2-dehydropantoate 2-reductase
MTAPVSHSPIVIWGAGAIGGTLGAAFIRAGHEVIFVDTVKEHVDAINEKGLSIVGPIFEATVKAKAYLPDELEDVYARIFLCVKSHHTEIAAKALAPHLAKDGYVVSAQNGLNELVIGRIVGDDRTIGCFVNFGADYLEPGVINYGGRAAVVIGEIDGTVSERVKAIHAMLKEFEERAILTENIWGYLWGKLVYGALLFATAATNDSIADVFDNKALRPVMTRLAHEVGFVAAAKNVRLEAFDGFDPAAFAPSAPAELTAQSFDGMVVHNRKSTKSHSGVWRDLAVRKRKTEVDAQILPIAKIGQSLGIATPLTLKLVDIIHDIEEGRRPLDVKNLEELAEVAA